MWLHVTDQRGELVSIADRVYFSASYKPVQCTQSANGFELVPNQDIAPSALREFVATGL